MAIGSTEAPYIHSTFLNFKRGEFGTTTKDIKKSSLLQEKIMELEEVKNDLQIAAENFLQGKTPKELLEAALGETNEFVEISRKVLRNKNFYYSLSARLKTRVKIGNLSKKTQEIIHKYYDQTIESLHTEEVVGAIIREVSKKEGGIKKNINLQKYFETIFGREFPEQYAKEISKRLTSTKSSGKLSKILKDYINNTYGESYHAAIGPVVEEVFKDYFNREYNILGAPTTAQKEQAKREYLNEVCENITKELQEKTGRDVSNLFGYGGEEIFAAVHNVKGSEVHIEVVGSLSEDELNIDEISPSTYSLRQTNKKSYSDLIIEYKGKRARVQSKNYQTVLNKYIEQTGMGKDQDILQQIHLLQGEKILDFFERIKGTNLDIDLKEAAYVMANEAWFSTAGNIPNKNFATVTKMDLHQNYIDAVLSGALINYLGVMLNKNKVNVDRSNIFYLIDNKALVPTYVIIENLIKNLKEWSSESEGIYLRLQNPRVSTSALKFLREKEKAVAGIGFKGSSYTDEKLVGVGTAMGEKIMDELTLKSINLNISLKNLVMSSWQF